MLNYLTPNCMKYSHLYRIALYLVCLIALASCNNFLGPTSGEKKAIPIEQNPLYPLKVGNFWRYALINYYSLLNKYDTTSSPTYNIIRIVADTIVEYQQSKYQCVITSNSNELWSSTKSEVFAFNSFDIRPTTFRNTKLRFPLQIIPFRVRLSQNSVSCIYETYSLQISGSWL